MELVKNAIAFSQREVEGSVELSCYKVHILSRLLRLIALKVMNALCHVSLACSGSPADLRPNG